VHWIVLEPLLILLQQSASRLDIDQNLQRHRAVSLRQHGFLVYYTNIGLDPGDRMSQRPSGRVYTYLSLIVFALNGQKLLKRIHWCSLFSITQPQPIMRSSMTLQGQIYECPRQNDALSQNHSIRRASIKLHVPKQRIQLFTDEKEN